MNTNVKYSEEGRCGPSWSMVEKVFKKYDKEPLFITFVEAEYNFRIAKNSHEINEDWVGIIHDPLNTHRYYMNHGKFRNHLNGKGFRKSLNRCQGLFFLTQTECNKWKVALNEIGLSRIECDFLYHPIQNHDFKFSWKKFIQNKNKKVIQTGHWLRIPYSIFKLNVPTDFSKAIVPYDDRQKWYLKLFNKTDGIYPTDSEFNSVNKIPTLSFKEYLNTLTENILYMELCEVSANNTILDAILMNTPLIVNKLDGVVEYLGEDYPLYFENRDEVYDLLNSSDKLEETYIYLKKMDKSRFSLENFGKSIFNSKIWRR